MVLVEDTPELGADVAPEFVDVATGVVEVGVVLVGDGVGSGVVGSGLDSGAGCGAGVGVVLVPATIPD